MGFFSWKTQDTNKSISNVHSERGAFTVYLMDDKGNTWKEDSYCGYGSFGGKDFYVLLAEMNGKGSDRDQGISLYFGIRAVRNKKTGEMFKHGLRWTEEGDIVVLEGRDFCNWEEDILKDGMSGNQLLETGDWENLTLWEEGTKFPNLVEDKNWKYINKMPEDCPEQGYFYDED